ncbi:MAG: hypothetical protein CMH54_02605 [Myxococcales bacterium]|nr:hypothetical protein [Myxococcales bacterium]|tara:strand:- start:158 stop:463 length:306 start_codon:yes stop_codon:yes gene_type:complete
MLHAKSAQLRFSTNDNLPADVLAVNAGGITIDLHGGRPTATHVWVRFGLPDNSGECLALGTIIESCDQVLRIQFKHLFPDMRQALDRALANCDADSEMMVA